MTHLPRSAKRTPSRRRLLVLSSIALIAVLFNVFAAPIQVVSAATNITVQGLLDQHNAERRLIGLPPLRLNNALTVSAQRKAQAMLAANCWSHYCPNGKEPWAFFREAGYVYKVAGENLAEGFFTTEDVIKAWMTSPSHRDNVLRSEYEEIGFGVVQGNFQGKANNIVIAVHFGTPLPVLGADATVNTPGELPTPKILLPENGQAFNKNPIIINGTAPEATQVKLYNNGQLFVTTDASQGIFTYQAEFTPGDYALSAISAIGERSSVPSAPVQVKFDVAGDPISIEDLVINQYQPNRFRLLLSKPDLVNLSFTFGSYELKMNTSDGKLWEGDLQISLIPTDQYFSALSVDTAGNDWNGVLPTAELRSLIEVARLDKSATTDGSGRVIAASTKVQGNIFFIGFLLILFAFDYFRVQDTGYTQVKGLASLHIGLIVVLVIIVLSGTFFGQILTGVKI